MGEQAATDIEIFKTADPAARRHGHVDRRHFRPERPSDGRGFERQIGDARLGIIGAQLLQQRQYVARDGVGGGSGCKVILADIDE